jgi:hypothetical protein
VTFAVAAKFFPRFFQMLNFPHFLCPLLLSRVFFSLAAG